MSNIKADKGYTLCARWWLQGALPAGLIAVRIFFAGGGLPDFLPDQPLFSQLGLKRDVWRAHPVVSCPTNA
jgi:hypothetical protein